MSKPYSRKGDNRSLVICSTSDGRDPIMCVSTGFEDLFGYNADECVGKDCSELVGGRSLLDTTSGHDALIRAAEGAGLSDATAASAVGLMADAAARAVLAARDGNCESVLLLNRKKSDELFVCEMAVSQNLHPILKWSYNVGVQRDVTEEVPVSALLQACATGGDGYDALCETWRFRSQSMHGGRLSTMLEGTASFNEMAERAWRQKLTTDLKPETKKASAAAKDDIDMRSLASRSTTCSKLSAISSSTQGTEVFHLGALMELDRKQEELTKKKLAAPDINSGRFFDLLEPVEDEDSSEEDAERLETDSNTNSNSNSWQSAWSSEPEEQRLQLLSLKESASAISRVTLRVQSSALVIAEPCSQELPALTCSRGFERLTGFKEDLLGRDLRSLIIGASLDSLFGLQLQMEWRAFCDACMEGRYYASAAGAGVALLEEDSPEIRLAEGELAFVHTLRCPYSNSLRCLVHFKQVELDGKMYVLGLLSIAPEKGNRTSPAGRSALALQQLSAEMDEAIALLGAEFFYSAPMRRQIALPLSSSLRDLATWRSSSEEELPQLGDSQSSLDDSPSPCSEFLSDGS